MPAQSSISARNLIRLFSSMSKLTSLAVVRSSSSTRFSKLSSTTWCSLEKNSAVASMRFIRVMSSDICSTMPGRRTFTATTLPSNSTPLCTCAMDADPNGVGSMARNTSVQGFPYAASRHFATCSNDMGVTSA